MTKLEIATALGTTEEGLDQILASGGRAVAIKTTQEAIEAAKQKSRDLLVSYSTDLSAAAALVNTRIQEHAAEIETMRTALKPLSDAVEAKRAEHAAVIGELEAALGQLQNYERFDAPDSTEIINRIV